MLKRPSAQDTEEDILKLQEEFLASKASPGVSIVKKPEKRKSHEGSSSEARDTVSLKGVELFLEAILKCYSVDYLHV